MTSATSILAHPSMRVLLSGSIDYAGLFPPASLDLETVVANYHDYRRGSDAWALGRLVVPAARLVSLGEVASGTWRAEAEASGAAFAAWRVSALVGHDVPLDATLIADFNRNHGSHAVVDCVETRAATVEQVKSLAGYFPDVQHFIEMPLAVDLARLLRAVGEIGASAKIRTGGVTPDAFPAARDVARFLRASADAGVPFKATAGLHHPLRGDYRLTYDPESPRATMFGYLNLLLAASQALEGASVDCMLITLEGRNTSMLGIVDDEIRWEGLRASTESISRLRGAYARAFGSCSFREPLDELGTLFAD